MSSQVTMNHEAECWHGPAEHTAHGTGVKMTPMTSSVQELSTNLNKVSLTRTSLPTSAFTIKNPLRHYAQQAVKQTWNSKWAAFSGHCEPSRIFVDSSTLHCTVLWRLERCHMWGQKCLNSAAKSPVSWLMMAGIFSFCDAANWWKSATQSETQEW